MSGVRIPPGVPVWALGWAPVAQLDRATDSGSVCREFESLQARQYTGKIHLLFLGSLAQLVEQLTLNQRVVGSNPTRPTKK